MEPNAALSRWLSFSKFISIILPLSAFIYCSGTTALRVSLNAENDFPVISIANPFGGDIEIKPIDLQTGSIGFAKDTLVTWLKGMPVEKKLTADETVYTWGVNGQDSVELVVSRGDGDLNFLLSQKSDDDSMPMKWLVNIATSETEYFTGALERVVDGPQTWSWREGIETALNLRGERVGMQVKPTVSAYAPFYLSSNHYGFFAQGTWPGMFDFCKEYTNAVQIAFEGPDLDFKLYLAATPMEIVQKHALETGPSFIPPDWAFGPWRWRDEHFNRRIYYDSTEVKAPFNSDIVEDVLLMKAYGIPCTAYWIDRPWAPGSRGFDDYEFDTERLPQPEEMIKWLNGHGMELMMWIAPFVMGRMADYAEQNGYYLESRPRGDARQVLMDFTNPDARSWWMENGPAKLARMGIKGFKLDRADGEKLLDSLDLKTFGGKTYRENFNDYPHQYVQATYDAVKPVLGDDFILYPRAQYTGSARYGGMWAGDTNGRPEGLRSVIIAVQRCAVMGYPLWGSDTGGYWGAFNHETTRRWLGFSCFSPIMEVGPTNNRGFWSNPDEPHYDAELIAAWRLYARTRMKLVPYLSALARRASETGMPIARPLFLVYPDQPEAWNDWQTYLLGKDILVSAIWQLGAITHKLYLPSGETWVDAWNPDKEYSGGQYIEVEAPPYKIPLFVRKGAAIQLGDLNALYAESLEIAAQKPDLAELERKEGWR
jgi:alpha-D-xyloside xylohydrolase